MLLSFDNRRIYYDLTGPESAPVLCITHSLASDSGMWAEQMPSLIAARFRVLRIDMRGHGGSDSVAGNYTMDQLAGDVALVLDALGIDRVHYMGLSIGGMIGQGFALGHGARLRSLMLCDTHSQSPLAAKAQWDERMEAVGKAKSVGIVADATMERWFTPAFKPRRPGRWKEIRETIAATNPQGYIGCSGAIMNFDYAPRLTTIKVPTLVVCGAEDPGTPPEANRRIASLIPGARYEEIPQARHFPNVEQAEKFNHVMLGWLEAQG